MSLYSYVTENPPKYAHINREIDEEDNAREA